MSVIVNHTFESYNQAMAIDRELSEREQYLLSVDDKIAYAKDKQQPATIPLWFPKGSRSPAGVLLNSYTYRFYSLLPSPQEKDLPKPEDEDIIIKSKGFLWPHLKLNGNAVYLFEQTEGPVRETHTYVPTEEPEVLLHQLTFSAGTPLDGASHLVTVNIPEGFIRRISQQAARVPTLSRGVQ